MPSPKALSARRIELRLVSSARSWASLRFSAASARSAAAAAAGSSLAFITRLPLVRRSCASVSAAWRRCSWLMDCS
jgi:hypothetical protein